MEGATCPPSRSVSWMKASPNCPAKAPLRQTLLEVKEGSGGDVGGGGGRMVEVDGSGGGGGGGEDIFEG